MVMPTQGRIRAILLTEFNAADLVANFLPINANGLDEACFILRIVNNSTEAITVSYDGVNNNEYIRSDDSLTLDGNLYNFRKGLIIYVAAIAAGVGTITLSGYYVGV